MLLNKKKDNKAEIKYKY